MVTTNHKKIWIQYSTSIPLNHKKEHLSNSSNSKDSHNTTDRSQENHAKTLKTKTDIPYRIKYKEGWWVQWLKQTNDKAN